MIYNFDIIILGLMAQTKVIDGKLLITHNLFILTIMFSFISPKTLAILQFVTNAFHLKTVILKFHSSTEESGQKSVLHWLSTSSFANKNFDCLAIIYRSQKMACTKEEQGNFCFLVERSRGILCFSVERSRVSFDPF